MILVDYACANCGARQENWAPSPPPAQTGCSSCGAQATRRFAPIGLISAPGRSATEPAPPQRAGPPLCTRYPQVPGLCHMSESAGRMWVAKYLNDNRTVDRELERQEARAKIAPPTMADAITHQHYAPTAEPTPAHK